MSVDPFDPNKRAEGTLLLVNAPWGGEPVYVEHYRVSALDDDAAVRLAGIRGLARHGGPEHVGLLTERLSDEDALVRREAARALQRLHNPEAIDALLDATQAPTDSVLVQQSGDGGEGEPDPEVRAAAAHALGQYAENRVVVSLIASLDDPYLSVNQSTLAALNTLTGQDFGYDRRDWQQWYDATEDIFAARRAYVYPTFQRDRKLIEYLPFIPPPPNEPQASPVGFPVEVGAR